MNTFNRCHNFAVFAVILLLAGTILAGCGSGNNEEVDSALTPMPEQLTPPPEVAPPTR